MLYTTHKIIAQKIAHELGFSEENTEIFVSGAVGPDSHADFPHASGKDKKILSKIDAARDLYFLNDEYAHGEIANALHYIQDKWISDIVFQDEAAIIDDDDLFLTSIKQSTEPEKVLEEYLQLASSLMTIRNNGIDSWFDHSWGIWHKDYASCIYVFADILELMLPTMQPNISITSNTENLKEYVESQNFRKATKEGFLSSIIMNFCYPKLAGYPAAMHSLTTITPPTIQDNPEVNLNLVYRLSLEIARYTLSSPELFRYQDSWTHRMEKDKHMPLVYVMPEYHILIPKPINEVQKERNLRFFSDRDYFLEEWPSKETLSPISNQHSETWKILLSGLIEILKEQ